MRTILILSVLVAAPLTVHAQPGAGSPPLAAARAADDPLPDKRPEVDKLLESLKAHADKRGAEDTEAVAVIDQLNQEFPKSGPKDRAAIVAGLSKCFEERRLDSQDGTKNNKLYLGAATALSTMGPESVKVLLAWIDNKNLRKDMAVQHRLILSLGKTKDKTAVEPLVKLLEYKDAPIVGAAAEALGEFVSIDLDTRKKAFEGMLKVLMSAKGAKDTNVQDTIAKDRYDTIAAPLITSLGKLAKHEERDPEEWQRWWNKNRTKNWDETK